MSGGLIVSGNITGSGAISGSGDSVLKSLTLDTIPTLTW